MFYAFDKTTAKCVLSVDALFENMNDDYDVVESDESYNIANIHLVNGVITKTISDEEQAIQVASAYRNKQLREADFQISTLQGVIDEDGSTPELEARLAEWKQYRISIFKVDVHNLPTEWPTMPESV